MLFNSYAFLVFFPTVCILYFAIRTVRWRNLFLLGASYYFYMNWEPVYALLLLSSTALTYLAALGIERFADSGRIRKLCLWGSVAANLCGLIFFKYYDFIGDNITVALRLLGIHIEVPDMGILLPVGISFYIFQALGYSIDVYRGSIKAERNFFTYALFVSFFPQLVAGPIERSTNLLRQFYEKHRFDCDGAIEGVKIMVWGYFLKLAVADRCAEYVNAVYNHIDDHEGFSTLLGSILFCFQLYGDFAGYTFIAIGSARIMGFRLMDNFRRPYLFSTSVQDYWKRNHISLTSWFMDYIYYPMTERKNTLNWWCFAILVTFVISGLWHGAAWTFILWGTLQGLLLVAEMRTNKKRRKWEKKHKLTNKEWYKWVTRIVTFSVIMLTLVFFRANSLSDAFTALRQIFTAGFGAIGNLSWLVIYFLPPFMVMFVKEYVEEYGIGSRFAEKHPDTASMLWLTFLFVCIFAFGSFSGREFIYFQF